MLACCLTLCYLSYVPSARIQDTIINSGMQALVASNSIDSHQCKKVAVATMANLVGSDDRGQVMEHIMPGIKYLAASNEPESWLLVVVAVCNLSRCVRVRF